MKNQRCPKKANAFTRIDLITVIAVMLLLASLTLPALAHTKSRNAGDGCVSNLRQMMIGWEMYKEDNGDNLLPNATVSMTDNTAWVDSRQPDWHNAVINTNVAAVLSGLLGPYVGGDVRVYKCPADSIPSDNGQRLRSRSMNSQMGYAIAVSGYNTAWRRYYMGSDLTCPTPANAWVFCDESIYTINDGYLQLNLDAPDYPDAPASYHGGNGCGFSFADGHAEDHRWISKYIISVPYAYGVSRSGAQHWTSSAQDKDYIWLSQHSACKN